MISTWLMLLFRLCFSYCEDRLFRTLIDSVDCLVFKGSLVAFSELILEIWTFVRWTLVALKQWSWGIWWKCSRSNLHISSIKVGASLATLNICFIPRIEPRHNPDAKNHWESKDEEQDKVYEPEFLQIRFFECLQELLPDIFRIHFRRQILLLINNSNFTGN